LKDLDYEEVITLYEDLIKEAKKTKNAKPKRNLIDYKTNNNNLSNKTLKTDSSADKFFEDFE
jgi:hypothetical protein